MPPGAIRTPGGGWITPLQTTDQNGKNLTIHYETGIPVSGSVMPPGPPPIIHMTIEANSKLYEKGDTITISGKEDNYFLQKYGNDLTLSIDDTRTSDRWCCDDFKSSPDGSFYFSFKMPDMFQSSDNYNVRVSPKNSTDEYGTGFLYYLSLPYPLEQFKSGISASDVKCSDNLVHIIKAEDNSPACVKPETSKILVERGWGMMSNLVFTNNISENNCGQFHTAPGSQQISTMPVLLMDSNSTACARLTFTIDRNPDTTLTRINFTSDLLIGNYNVSRHVNLLSVAPGKDFTHSFQITVIPQTVDLANFPIGSNFTVTYIIKPLPNATGFYDHSIPRLVCDSYPLAVGHTADHVNYSDFSYINQGINPCALGPYNLTAVEISGMSYKDIALPK
jgi:hypothetical protein